MSCKIVVLPEFAAEVKQLAKKYKKIKEDLGQLSAALQENPTRGIPLAGSCYKIRLANSSIPTGKSRGFRVIYYFVDEKAHIYLMSIYSKTEKENILAEEIKAILKRNGLIP